MLRPAGEGPSRADTVSRDGGGVVSRCTVEIATKCLGVHNVPVSSAAHQMLEHTSQRTARSLRMLTKGRQRVGDKDERAYPHAGVVHDFGQLQEKLRQGNRQRQQATPLVDWSQGQRQAGRRCRHSSPPLFRPICNKHAVVQEEGCLFWPATTALTNGTQRKTKQQGAMR